MYAFAREHEVVPQALRQRLGWKTVHDRTAARIMAAFPLTLPRDRELIRQLTFVRVAQSDGAREQEGSA